MTSVLVLSTNKHPLQLASLATPLTTVHFPSNCCGASASSSREMEPELSLSNFLNTAVTLESAAITTKVLIYKWQLPKCCITSSSKRRYRIILLIFFLAYLFYHVVFNVVAIVVGVVADVVVVGVQIGKASATTILWMFCWGL